MQKNKINFLFILSACFLGLAFSSKPLFDPDLGWHLLGGQYLLEQGQVPIKDFINSFNQYWHDYHWLAQIIFYKIYAISGFQGLVYLQAVLGLCLVVSLYFLILQSFKLASSEESKNYTNIVEILALLLAFYFSYSINSLRPQLIALILIAVAYTRLLGARKIWDGVLVTSFSILAVNLHVYWIFMPILWFCLRCAKSQTKSEKVHDYLVLILISSSGFISPYGLISINGNHSWYPLINYALIWDYLKMPVQLKDYIFEMRSSLAGAGAIPYLFVLSLLVIARGLNKKIIKSNTSLILIALLSTFLAFRSIKFIAVFAVLSLPIVVLCLQEIFRNLEIITKSTYLNYSLLIFSALFLFYAYPRKPLSEEAEFYQLLPVHACKKIAKMDLPIPANRNHLRILTHFNHGGWCRWLIKENAPEKDYRVTTDGRTQWVPPEHYLLSFDLYSVKKRWAETLQAWDPDLILVWKGASLAAFLSRSQGLWDLVHEDDDFAVFRKSY